MKKLITSFACLLCVYVLPAQDLKLPADTMVVTNHVTTIKGKKIPFTATAGTQPIWNKEGKIIAALNYVYYERTDVQDRSTRPLIMSFNGGPGSASVWMHLAYTGPYTLNIDDEGYPVQPYGIHENPNSILDVADIVYVNPINTGYSRILDKDADKKTFFGVNEDIQYLAAWLNTFVTRKNRWQSPKYLIGESYGTTRVSGLALELQESQWMYLNGVILVSPTELGIKRDGPVEMANRLPYFTAAAWYHKKLPADLQQKDLAAVLPESENFTLNELLPALAKGSMLDSASKMTIAQKMSRYSGISVQQIMQHNLDVGYNFFWKDLLRNEGYTIGRLDSRYLGMDREDAGDGPDYNAELTTWLHEFTPAINYYYKNILNWNTDIKYNMFGEVYPWNFDNDRTGENLRQAMAENPYLKLMVQSGYFDGACTYFDAKYSMWQMDPGGRLKNRMTWKGYRSGHMMYLRNEDLVQANDDIRNFIQSATPAKGQPAKY